MVMVSGPKGKWIKPFDRAIAARVRFLRGDRRFTHFTATEDRADLSELAGYVERGEHVADGAGGEGDR